jgi:hypothetical protein
MLKAGLIAGGVMFLFVLIGAAGVSPFCAFCVPLITGLGAGYLNGIFEKNSETAVQRGAYAGAIAGGLGLLAQMCASAINAFVLQNPQYQVINQSLDLPATDPGTVWMAQIGVGCCVGLVNLALNAGLGAGGGAIWKSTAGKNITPSTDELTPS